MAYISRAGTTLTLNIAHDVGTALNLTAAIEGFHFFDDGVEIPIISVTSDGISEITITLSTTPTGTEILYYIYDDEYPLDKTKIVQDNAAIPMPLQSGSIANPIINLPNLNHYSDPALSSKIFHSGNVLQEILPIKGVNKLEQADPAQAMEFNANAFNGLGGYIFPDNTRWMMYEADPTPFQIERTIGIVFSLQGNFNNDEIFGLAKYNNFNSYWRVQTTTSGDHVTFGRQETELGQWPTIIPSALNGAYIMIIRQLSLTQHEFYVNSYSNPVIINPQDNYWASNRVRLMLGRVGSTRSEIAATIGPVFDTFSLIPTQDIQKIMEYLSARTGIALAT